MTTHLIIPDQHAHPEHHNERATWLSKLILDIKPDVVINIGDAADMASLSEYDKGKGRFFGRTYRADILAHEDFQDRLWTPLKRRKKKLPHRVFLVGNHEYRVQRALDIRPDLEGSIGFQDFKLEDFYDDIVGYVGNTPGSTTLDGITYAHYFISGISGRAISSEHPAYALLAKNFHSSTAGHSHLLDYAIRTDATGRKIIGLNCGVYQDYDADWAGEINKMWWRGVVVKRDVENGNYNPQFISIDALRKEYG